MINPAPHRPSFECWCQQHAPTIPNSHRIPPHRKKKNFHLLLSTSTHCKPTTDSVTNRIRPDPPPIKQTYDTYDNAHGGDCEHNSIFLPVPHTTYVIPTAKLLRSTSTLRRHHVRFRMLMADLPCYRSTTVHDHAGTTTHYWYHHICTTRTRHPLHAHTAQTTAAFWTMISLGQSPVDQTQYHTKDSLRPP